MSYGNAPDDIGAIEDHIEGCLMSGDWDELAALMVALVDSDDDFWHEDQVWTVVFTCAGDLGYIGETILDDGVWPEIRDALNEALS